jgi:hypothetical protein
VRVAVLVRELVVLAVVSHPGVDRAFDGEAASDGEGDPQRPVRPERAVGEVAVEPDRDAVPGDQVHDHGEEHVEP